MNEFDKLCEKYASKSMTTSTTFRRPTTVYISDELSDMLADEYRKQYVEGNRNFHSNFIKVLKFEINSIADRCKNDPEFLADYVDDRIDSVEVADEVGSEPLPEEL